MDATKNEVRPLLDPKAIEITEKRGEYHSALKAVLRVHAQAQVDAPEERTNPGIREGAEACLRERIWADLYKPIMARVQAIRAMILYRCDLADEPGYREIMEELLTLLSPPSEQATR